jgi:hypothetical protein
VTVGTRGWTSTFAAPSVALVLVLGIGAERALSSRQAGGADAYHAAVRAAARLPERIGDWVGHPIDTPPAAVAMLRPNVLECRRYEHETTGEHVSLMLVQCRDVRDMSGHYPPVCYPAHGWTLRETVRRPLEARGVPVPTTSYRFTIESVDRFEEIVVYNFFVRPGGGIDADRSRVLGHDRRLRSFGAAQVQVVFDSSVSEERRDEVFGMLVGEVFPVVETIRGGGRS